LNIFSNFFFEADPLLLFECCGEYVNVQEGFKQQEDKEEKAKDVFLDDVMSFS
jgi:hypothetical protein